MKRKICLSAGRESTAGYNFWKHAGAAIEDKGKGEAVDELPPVDVRDLLP